MPLRQWSDIFRLLQDRQYKYACPKQFFLRQQSQQHIKYYYEILHKLFSIRSSVAF